MIPLVLLSAAPEPLLVLIVAEEMVPNTFVFQNG